MFQKVLIANRGAISCRIARTLRTMGVTPVALYSEPDRHSRHVLDCEERIALPGQSAQETYLNAELIIAKALEHGVEAVHPGYGFLSENAEFAQKCEAAGLVFLGPTPHQLETCGLKHLCRQIAEREGVPLLRGSGVVTSVEEALEAACQIGFPVMIKSSAGGGGIGMQVAHSEAEVAEKFEQVRRLSHANFDDSSLFIEKFIERARHIEVQVFGDGRGTVLSLGERDCSAQRRNQKVVEETPAPGLSDTERQHLAEAAVRLTSSVQYESAGTVEFLWDEGAREFYFLEINARLQVEHGVTEEVWGVDLVKWMVQLGAGELPPLCELELRPCGHAVQVRLYAEDPKKDYQPSSGLLSCFSVSPEVRCETWVEAGTTISPYYDPMLAKLIVYRESREDAISALSRALADSRVYGIETNLAFLSAVLQSEAFHRGEVDTRFLDRFTYSETRIEVLHGGIETTVQDFPGRLGRWEVGVPPSGPFDSLSFRLGNRLLGNEEEAAGIECSLEGPTLSFGYLTRFCLTGAVAEATLSGEKVAPNTVVMAQKDDVLVMGPLAKDGQRAYITVAGGLDVPLFLGSASTFLLGKFGGHAGRKLRTGDVVHAKHASVTGTKHASVTGTKHASAGLPRLPIWFSRHEIRVVYGPHGAPDFFTPEDIETFFSAQWEVHYNSDRTGTRLIGPKPKWARKDGGQAGLHPSNIHDNAYTVGSIDFTGDMPIILGPDGPSLGGFVCPAVVAKVDLWKTGQLRAGDRVSFINISIETAERLLKEQESALSAQAPLEAFEALTTPSTETLSPPILCAEEGSAKTVVLYRQSGDGVILVEYGEMVLDLDLRFRVQALYEAILRAPFEGLLELVPGIRSLQVQFDPLVAKQEDVLSTLKTLEENLPAVEEMEFPSRILHLPLAWDDASTQQAIERYMQIVRSDAPWCPSNIEFIRRINGLGSEEEVKKIVYEASYFVLGLGDVYLGAPVATPLDPRHRLVTTKYNPARTWTPENAVGIGGAYLCIYGMEGPGGYQFVGRTLPIWNHYRKTEVFKKPWLLRFFDQIRWYPVREEELEQIREDFLTGQYEVKVEQTTFRVKDYHAFLAENSSEIEAFSAVQEAAFEVERAEWERTGALTNAASEEVFEPAKEELHLSGQESGVEAPVVGSLWKVLRPVGALVESGETIIIIESMKTEFSVSASRPGVVKELLVDPGETVRTGQLLAVVDHG